MRNSTTTDPTPILGLLTHERQKGQIGTDESKSGKPLPFEAPVCRAPQAVALVLGLRQLFASVAPPRLLWIMAK